MSGANASRAGRSHQVMKGFLALCLTALATFSVLLAAPQQLQQVTISYPARTGTTWPLYIAKEGGYYEKQGLDVKLVYAAHPAGIAMVSGSEAVMTNYTLEQAMQAGSRDGSFTAVASSFKKSLFELMAAKNISSVLELRGKTIGVTALGDAPYNYAIGLLQKSGLTSRDVKWVALGGDVNARAAALASGRIDATMLTAPAYFKLEQEGFKALANISDYDDIYAPTVYLFKTTTVTSNRKLPEQIIKAHAEAIKRFYADKGFALKAYLAFDKQEPKDVERVYDAYAKTNVFERVPYILEPAVQYILAHPPDDQVGAQFEKANFKKMLDNSLITRLVREGYFEKLFGPGIKAEQDAKAKIKY
jgi:ABC-type nitrate/sulfonate/bicarbonate transport system substrate-binding protein